MPVQMACPNPDCDASYSIADENLGRIGRCKKCGTKFPLVPLTRAEMPPPPASSTDSDSWASPHPPVEFDLPSPFGRYKILRGLGTGGMGAVYLAHDSQLDRPVALKVPHREFVKNALVRERFLREARAAARFHHPNFCPIFDTGEIDGIPYLTMAYIEGGTLSSKIEKGQPWDQRKAAKVVRQLAVALAEAHRQRVIHRDLKPSNVMIDARGRLILMDFGLARRFEGDDPTLTNAGAVIGTPAYMSPEQAAGDIEAIGPHSDLYSLGVIFYELLTGRLPFEGPVLKVLRMISFVEPTPPSTLRTDLDARLEAICLKAMAKKPDDRHATMDQLAGALAGFLAKGTAPSTKVNNTLITNSLGIKLRLIPAGKFLMGSDDSDPEAGPDEKVDGRKHPVRITRPFYLGTTQVTVGQFRQFVQGTNYKSDAERKGRGGYGWDESKGTLDRGSRYTWRSPGFPQAEDHPVVNVSWNDAMTFCEWLSEQEGIAYYLPTEAEWEYACRAGQESRYSSGDDPESLALVGNVADGAAKEKYPNWKTIQANDGFVFTAPVGQFRPNAFGLYDMHGNVWEWCADWFDPEYYAKSPRADPLNSSPGSSRVIRGGSWSSAAVLCRAAYRGRYMPLDTSSILGLRLAQVPSGQ